MSYVSASPTQGTCATLNAKGGVALTCAIGPLAGSNATVTLIVVPNSAGVVSNTTTVSAKEADPNTANNSATAVVTVP